MAEIFPRKRGRHLIWLSPGVAFALFCPLLFAQPEGYYDTADNSSPQALHQSLHEIIDDHQRFPYTDTHSLFLSDIDYNFGRSNHPFNYCDTNCFEYVTTANNGRGGVGGGYTGDSNWQIGEFTEGRWEVWNGRRGDVARALMYMDVRYEGGTHGVSGVSEPDLILTDDLQLIDDSRTGKNEPAGYMGMLSVLLDWHRQDPVDLVEIQHHEAVASFQGNRNPFKDCSAGVIKYNIPSVNRSGEVPIERIVLDNVALCEALGH